MGLVKSSTIHSTFLASFPNRSLSFSKAVALENATYEINVPAGQELIYGVIAGTIDYNSSVSRYTTDPFETFVFSLK